MTQIEEPLLESAPLALRLATQLCRKDPVTGEDCSWEHGIWQYLRAIGLVGTIESRAHFYHQALAAATAAIKAPRVLLSGTADYALLALVLQGFRKRGVAPAVSVIDLCETPLALNRWYAQRAAIELETVHSDIAHFTSSAPFDAICTDAFFGRFAVGQRAELVAKWRELLRPGGVVITTNRLRPAAAERLAFSLDQVQAFGAAAHRAALEIQHSLRIDPGELARRAEIYARRHFTYTVKSAQEIRELFERAGFKVEHLASVTPAETSSPHGTSGPSVRGNPAANLRIVATRL